MVDTASRIRLVRGGEQLYPKNSQRACIMGEMRERGIREGKREREREMSSGNDTRSYLVSRDGLSRTS